MMIMINSNDGNDNSYNNNCTRRGARAEVRAQRCTRSWAGQRLGFSKG